MLLTARKTLENRSFQSERHIETSYVVAVVTVASVAEAIQNTLYRVDHNSPSISYTRLQAKTMKLAKARTKRTGACMISQQIQNTGNMIDNTVVHTSDRTNHIGASIISATLLTKLQDDPIIIQMNEKKLSTNSMHKFQNGRRHWKNSTRGTSIG